MTTTANFRVMLITTNDSAIYFDRILLAIKLEASGDPKAATLWTNIAKRGSRLELSAGGDLEGFEAVECGRMIRDEYAESIAEVATQL